MTKAKVKENWTKLESKVRKFAYTDYYFIALAIITFIGFITKNFIVGFVGLIGYSCFVLLFLDDILPLVGNIFFAPLMIYSDEVSEFISIWPIFIPLGICILIFVIRNIKNKHFTLGKMFFPQLAVTFALLIGGVGVIAKDGFLRALPTTLVLGVGVLAVYMLVNHFLKRDKDIDYAGVFSKMLMYIGLVAGLQGLITGFQMGAAEGYSFTQTLSHWNEFYIDVGWGNRNNIATLICFAIPLTMYLSVREKNKLLYYFIALIQYLFLIVTFSRGGILFGTIGLILAIVFAYIKSNTTKTLTIFIICTAVVGLIVYLCAMSQINAFLGSFTKRLTNVDTNSDITTGRMDLYKEAWEAFLAHPIQGVGTGYAGSNFSLSTMAFYWFHSTILQILGSIGLIGVVCYGYYYVIRFRILAKQIHKTFTLFILTMWISFEGYSLIDAGTFTPFPNMILIMISTLLLEVMAPYEEKAPYAEPRKLYLSGTINYRELGGLKTVDGLEIKPNTLIRGDALNKISKRGMKQLYEKYNVRTIVDLRTKTEMEQVVDKTYPGIDYYHMPVFNEGAAGISREKDIDYKELVKNAPTMNEMYSKMVLDPEIQESLSKVIKFIMSKVKEGGVIYHCTAGKDRTGIVSLVLLTMLGVSKEEIIKDYLLTQKALGWKIHLVKIMFLLKSRSKETTNLVVDMFSTKEEYINASIDSIEREYGSIDSYINDVLHISKEDIDEFKQCVLPVFTSETKISQDDVVEEVK